MPGNRFRSESGMDAAGIEGLSALLRQWKGVEPRSDFEAAVWRKIRMVSPTGIRRITQAGRFPGWLTLYPARTTAVAAAAAVIVGIGMGFLSQRTYPIHPPTHPLLQSRTVAGAYLSVATGELR